MRLGRLGIYWYGDDLDWSFWNTGFTYVLGLGPLDIIWYRGNYRR